jgi:thioredoxin reductase (NADPH)
VSEIEDDRTYEVLVVGGGPAGLSAAIYLARYARTVALFDSGGGRSSWCQVNYNYLGFVDGIPARELRAVGRRQVARYDQVHIYESLIRHMRREGDLFVAENGEDRWRGAAVIFCTGVVDYWPQFPGWEEYVGRSMFWCLTCDGYASRGMHIVVTGNDDHAAVTARQFLRFSPHVTMLTNAPTCEISPAEQKLLAEAGIPLIDDTIKTADGTGGFITALYTTGGRCIPCERVFSQQGARPQTQLAVELGVELRDNGYIMVDEEQCTNVPGVFAAGDVDGLHAHQITTAVHEGGQAASAANYYLYPPELKHH